MHEIKVFFFLSIFVFPLSRHTQATARHTESWSRSYTSSQDPSHAVIMTVTYVCYKTIRVKSSKKKFCTQKFITNWFASSSQFVSPISFNFYCLCLSGIAVTNPLWDTSCAFLEAIFLCFFLRLTSNMLRECTLVRQTVLQTLQELRQRDQEQTQSSLPAILSHS